MYDKTLTVVKEETKQIKAAKKIIEVCARNIKLKMRFFIYILSVLNLLPVEEDILICSDGENLYFNAQKVLKQYKAGNINIVERTIFHILLHGVLGHFENTKYTKTALAWAVMDLQVHRLTSLIYPDSKKINNDDFQYYTYGKDTELMGDDFLADELYYRGLEDKKMSRRIIRKGKEVSLDDHDYWYHNFAENKQYLVKEQNGENEKILIHFEKQKKIRELWKKAREFMGVNAEHVTENMEKRMEIIFRSDMQGFFRGQGSLRKENQVSYQDQSRNGYDEVLREITSLSEVSKDDDSIDKALYTYGLELYGDIPLIEPEEIRETKHIHTMVLAVDTSGSCTESAAVFLKEMEKLFEQIKDKVSIDHLCYLECDDQITAENNYYQMDNFIGFGNTHTFVGGGGTSFVPVFERADKLMEQGEIIDVLFYFSDCEGEFPQEKPKYPVVFLQDIPDWAGSSYFSDLGEYVYIPDWVKVIPVKNNK